MDAIKKIIFVCTGNTCRSPMALAIAKREAKRLGLRVEMTSAGTTAQSGDRATPEAIEACREIGLDISGHVAHTLGDGNPDENTLLVAMTHQHASWLRYVNMIPADQIYLLGSGVPDPYGRGIEEYRETRDAIEQYIKLLFERIGCDLPQADSFEEDVPRELSYYIYPMTDDCAAEVSLLENRCFPDPWSLAMLSEEMDNPDAVFLVAIGDESDIGGKSAVVYGYGCIIVAADVALLVKLCVSDDVRRMGIAAELAQELEKKAIERGATELTLEVRVSNAPAIALYEKLGFESMGVRPNFYSSPKEDALIMTKAIGAAAQNAEAAVAEPEAQPEEAAFEDDFDQATEAQPEEAAFEDDFDQVTEAQPEEAAFEDDFDQATEAQPEEAAFEDDFDQATEAQPEEVAFEDDFDQATEAQPEEATFEDDFDQAIEAQPEEAAFEDDFDDEDDDALMISMMLSRLDEDE